MNVLLAAEESAGIQVLRKLVGSPHRVAGVLTESTGGGRGATVSTLAHSKDLRVMPSALVKEPSFADWMRQHEVDLFLNVHSLHVVAPDVIRSPRIGSFNLHPGPLPEYAGLNSPSWALYNGESSHAVTLHWMDPGIDTGPVAYTERFAIADEDTGLSVAATCVRLGVPLVERLLQDAAADPRTIPTLPQTGERRYFGRGAPNGGTLSWERPALEVVRFVRAADYTPFASPWGHPLTAFGRSPIAIVKASQTGDRSTAEPGTVGDRENGAVRVACADEWVLVRRVQANGSFKNASEVLAPGAHLADPGLAR